MENQTHPLTHPSSADLDERPVRAYAASSAVTPLGPHAIRRRRIGPRDVKLRILFCGVCHSDLHQARDEWHESSPAVYPCVPGHEIIGRVEAVGRDVKRFREGDLAAVGCIVDSCRECENCRDGLEQYCEVGFTGTYNAPDPHTGGVTYGGYSEEIVVDEGYVLRVPDGADPAGTAPLLCAGITTYSPLRHWNVGPGQKVGIVGLGGLGHMGVKFADAFGAHVVLLTSTPRKRDDGFRLGADEVIISRDLADMSRHAGSFDFILNTVSAPLDINIYLALLKRDGVLVMVGAPPDPLPTAVMGLIAKRSRFAGSLIGGIRETQEMLDFCAERGITSDIEPIRMDQINEAYERMLRSDVKYRFVIDMATLR